MSNTKNPKSKKISKKTNELSVSAQKKENRLPISVRMSDL